MKIKEKISDIRGKIDAKTSAVKEKFYSIGFIKKWREKQIAQANAGPDPQSITEIYKKGSTKTRVQVVFMFFLAAVGIFLFSLALKKILNKYRPHENPVYEKIAHDLDTLKKQEDASASMISVGYVEADAANHTNDLNRRVRLGLDLWVKVGSPMEAKFVEENYLKFTDKAVEGLNLLHSQKVSLINDEGKDKARNLLKEKLNEVSKTVKIKEIFINNLRFQ